MWCLCMRSIKRYSWIWFSSWRKNGISAAEIPAKIGVRIRPDVKQGRSTLHTLWIANDMLPNRSPMRMEIKSRIPKSPLSALPTLI